MKIQLNLPTNEAFFNRYATLVPTLSKLGIIAQLISGLTEIGIIYSIILSRVSEFAPNSAVLLAAIGAIIGTLFLEVGLRKFAPYTIKAFLYKRFKGLDLAMTIFIVIVCIGLLSVSALLSFQGSKELVSIASPPPKLESTTATDKAYQTKKAELSTLFKTDSTIIATGYLSQIQAENKRFEAKVAAHQNNLNRYTQKEKRTGRNYQSRKESIQRKIKALEVEQAEQIAQLEAAQAKDLKMLVTTNRTALEGIENLYLLESNAIKNSNTTAIDKAAGTTSYYGKGLAWFTIICLCVFIFSVILEQIHKKGSGIEQVALPNQYYFSQPIVTDFVNMLSDKFNYKLRTRIQKWATNTPAPPLPTAPPQLYDLAEAKQQRLIFKVANEEEQHYLLNNELPELDAQKATIIQKEEIAANPKLKELEPIILQYLKAYLELNKSNLSEEAQQVELKAEQVIKAYLGEQATVESITTLKTAIIDFIEGNAPNPFDHHHRKPIGFNTKNKDKENPVRKSYNDTPSPKQRTCVHCSKNYEYRHHKQKYCTNECRIEAWETRTGKTLKLKKKK